ncbi:MAG: thiamine diphosphokinase [Clostridia bacterium]|nr:thiamine diphosphokinase [Clostridia bacterium]
MKPGICYIVAAGDAPEDMSIEKRDGDVVIACDAGYRTLDALGIVPDVFIGDGDSLNYIPDVAEKEVLPCVKDDTDTFAAIEYALERGFTEFRIYGALGGKRFSHTVANVKSLSYIAKRGGRGVIIDDDCKIYLLTPDTGEFILPETDGYFSVFAVNADAKVSIFGAKYELNRARLTPDSTLGCSNEPKGKTLITVFDGEVLVITDK